MTTPAPIFGRGSWAEDSRIATVLRKETVGGVLLLVAAVVALVWANSPWGGAYEALRDTRVGPASLHLDLTLGTWAADGLLAIFFFVVGLELKREFVAGDLRDVRRAVVPVAAAVGGMIMPAVLYVLINLNTPGALAGWAIPTATDIAFAVAALAVISTHLPTALRTFLLTLAVVDDLLAILIIAIFYTSSLALTPLLLMLLPLAAFGFLVQKRITAWWLLVPLAVLTWGLMHASGVHSTVAGVLLGFTVPVVRSAAAGEPGKGPGMAERLERLIRPLSAGVAVPVFAFFAAGVAIGSFSGLGDSLADTVAIGIIVGLVAGKPLGILAATWLVSRFTRAEFADELSWWDLLGMGLLGGIGFTVSLLVGELSFAEGSPRHEHVKVGVLVGSLTAVLLAAVVLRTRNRLYRRLWAEEQVDADADSIPDVYQRKRSGADLPPTGGTPAGPGGTATEPGGTAAEPGGTAVPPPGRTAPPSADS